MKNSQIALAFLYWFNPWYHLTSFIFSSVLGTVLYFTYVNDPGRTVGPFPTYSLLGHIEVIGVIFFFGRLFYALADTTYHDTGNYPGEGPEIGAMRESTETRNIKNFVKQKFAEIKSNKFFHNLKQIK